MSGALAATLGAGRSGPFARRHWAWSISGVGRVLDLSVLAVVKRPVPAGTAGCWGRNGGRPLKEGLRGPTRERNGVIPRQPSDVDEPNDRLNTGRGTHAEHELAELLFGEISTDTVERLGDPCDRTSLTQGERASVGGVGLEG